MTITKTQENGKITLTLNGRLDTTTAPSLQEDIVPAIDEANEIVVDFADLTYVSSAGLRVLLMAEKMAKASDKTMILSNISEEIMEVFEMTGFANILTFA
ncbi:MAG: STAS domain-containing protein [Oscillospiraceae bacterium]|jgi:anti-anti-sigma factor|nr:STAS domain-containing protein [Oscillospiraceae bacterium]